jgi:glycosyltransferase involved in cell wall biosynthesis
MEQLRALAAKLGIAARVVFSGPLYGQELRQAYAQTGIFAYPSRYENFGQTILEAAAAGCALVTTRVGVALDLIEEGVSGFLIEPDAPALLAGHLQWLLEHPAEQAAIGHAAHTLARQNYAWEPILQLYADLYEDVLEHATHSRGRWHVMTKTDQAGRQA